MLPARETFFPRMLTLSPAKPKSLLQSWRHLVLASPNKGPFTGLFTSFASAPPSSTGHIWGINPFLPSTQSTMHQRVPDAKGQKVDFMPPLHPPQLP